MSAARALDDPEGASGVTLQTTLVSSEVSPWAKAQLIEWLPVLRQLNLSTEEARRALDAAERAGTSLPDELLASGVVAEEPLYRAIAVKLGLRFRAVVAPGELTIGVDQALKPLRSGRTLLAQTIGRDGFMTYISAPRPGESVRVNRVLQENAALFGRVSLSCPSVVRRALIEIARPRLVELARDSLFSREPRFSARFSSAGWQAVLLGGLSVGLPISFALSPWITLLALHAFATMFFMACVAIRVAAVFTKLPRQSAAGSQLEVSGKREGAEVPFYTVLIALRDEVDVLPDLIAAIGRLQWPRDRFEVKFICEDDDRRTIDALKALPLRPWAEIVEVPRGMPGTKPNALDYALPLSRGDIIAVYDAEDRPHPSQLQEAWNRFRVVDENLACLQAPLDIDNGSAGILPRMFALEYAGLFRRFLPYLAKRGLFIPLGGTSNHFRRAALDHVGAWDPYNVTEDADLGIRLARHGYRTGVLFSPTGEDAPEDYMVWIRQRTRWLKGWAQTWLVHMRSPAELARDLGFRSLVAVQVLLAGLIVSSLLHPLLFLTGTGLAAKAIATGGLSPFQFVLFGLDAFNIVLGYGAFLTLGWRATQPAARRGFWKVVLFTPVYWMMMSYAAWRAVIQLRTKPHYWEKTPHARHRRPDQNLSAAYSPRNAGPSPMIFASSEPTASVSRPS